MTAPSEASPVLRVADLHVRYGRQPETLKGVSVSVSPGQVVGVIGESGSGKSSLALAVMGLLPRSANVVAREMKVDGVDVLTADQKQWRTIRGRKVGFVFQEPLSALNPTLRIDRHLNLALRSHADLPTHDRRQRILELLESVQVRDPERIARQYPHQLSGGERQRVLLGLALAHGPSLLVADEPTTALDSITQKEILSLLQRLTAEEHLGVLFISHDLSVIATIADQVIVLKDGEIVQAGTVSQILTAPHPYTASLLAAIPGSVPPRKPLLASNFSKEF